jgi:type IV pilus assembly protein PilW
MTTRQHHRLHQGFSLIEIMVGVVIGLIAVLVIYQIFAAAEGIKRNTTSVGDAQQNGLLSSFMLGIELANAGNGVAYAARPPYLQNCPGNASVLPATAFASTWRPLPLVIVDGGGPTLPDSFMVNYSLSNAAIAPAPFTAPLAATGDDYSVHSPTGFQPNDLIVAISTDGTCAASKATFVSAPDVLGIVNVRHTDPGGAVFLQPASLLNMGPAGSGQKVLYDVTGAGVLRSTALLKDDGTPALGTIAPNPLASNVVNLKLQYGLDVDKNGVLEWVSADVAPWRAADLVNAPDANVLVTQLKTLKAVRIGIVVRGEQWDKEAPDVPWSLFGGIYSGTFVRAGGNYRYRIYETVIPLRNELWNAL